MTKLRWLIQDKFAEGTLCIPCKGKWVILQEFVPREFNLKETGWRTIPIEKAPYRGCRDYGSNKCD